jgi:hypothetical protein
MVGVAGFEPATPASRTQLSRRIALKSREFWLHPISTISVRSRRSRGYPGVGLPRGIQVFEQELSVGCGDTQHPILREAKYSTPLMLRWIARCTSDWIRFEIDARSNPPSRSWLPFFCINKRRDVWLAQFRNLDQLDADVP